MKKTIFKKVASLFLAVLITLTSLVAMPFSASAVTATENWLTANFDGDKTYTVNNASDLLAFKAALASKDFAGETVKLTQNVDMTGVTWTCATDTFKGTFDGCGYSIQNLSGSATANFQGLLFGKIVGGTVQNLSIVGGTFTSRLSGGVISGTVSPDAENNSLFQNIYVNTTVVSSVQDSTGFLGRVNDDITIKSCVVASTIYANGASAYGGFSGFVARLLDSNNLEAIDCAFSGNIVCKASKGTVSSFLSVLEGSAVATFTDCFNMGTITREAGGISTNETSVDTISTETFNFANYTKANADWVQTGKNEMMPASVAQMLGKSYTPEGSEEHPGYVTTGEKIYTYECMTELADITNSRVLLNGYISGASDTWNIEATKKIEDGTTVSLKNELIVPQSHITFILDIETAGTYKFAIEYQATHNDAYQHMMQFSIDNLGKESLYLQYFEGYCWLVVTQKLEAGEHSFTVYAPDNRFGTLENGKVIQSCNVRNFKVYQPITAHGLSVVDGAAVKMDSETGVLRYTSRIDKSLYDMLVDTYGEKNVVVGTLFAAASDAAEVGTLSKEIFNKEVKTYYDDSKAEIFEDENGYYFYGYWDADSAEEYDDMMSVAAYIRFKDGAQSKYIYTVYNAENDRSIAMVASKAIVDTKTASENGYENAVTVNGTTVYSPYSATEYANLVALAAYYQEG